MSTVLHMPAFNSAPHGPAFTSVNGRLSLSPPNEQKPSVAAKSSSSTWTPVSPDPEPSHHSPDSDTSASTVSSGDKSPNSSDKTRSSPENPNKRRRSGSEEDAYAQHSPDQTTAGPRQLPPPYQPLHRITTTSMEAPQLPSLPPLGRPDAERRWQTEPRELPHATHHFHHREPHPTLPTRNNALSPESREMAEETEFTRAGVQVELKKRKRQFANRTKTGCGTCRRRKKKCDEAKPECNNCTRGGFVCEGYANKVPWTKNGPAKPPAILAKEKYAAYTSCPTCQEKHTPHCGPPQSSEASYPPPDMHSATSTERKPWKSWSDPAPPPVRTAYQPEAPPPPPPPQYMQPTTNHYERPSSHDHQSLSQQQSHHSSRGYHHTPPSSNHLAINTAVPTTTTTTTTIVAKPVQQLHVAQQHPRPPPPPPPLPTSLPPTRSPTRFSDSSSMTYRSEKDKMLAGEPFNPFDKTLMHERHLSTQAQSIFNSSKANPTNVLSSTTVDHFFKQILNASRHREGKQIEIHMGPNCHVATPFACDYGYHLSMGENVVIGADCHLHDSARISIGRNCKLGVRVTIQTLKTPTDNKSLKGSNGKEVAHEVHIGENVYIGDNCVIEAGVHIGPNTIVRPGSVVSRSLPANCVAHGNPAIILPN